MEHSQDATTNKRRFLSWRTLGIGAVIITAATAFIVAEITSSKDLWRLPLNAQLQKDKRCRLDDMLASSARKVDGVMIVEGKVRCADGRMFTFSGRKIRPKFKLKACQPGAC